MLKSLTLRIQSGLPIQNDGPTSVSPHLSFRKPPTWPCPIIPPPIVLHNIVTVPPSTPSSSRAFSLSSFSTTHTHRFMLILLQPAVDLLCTSIPPMLRLCHRRPQTICGV